MPTTTKGLYYPSSNLVPDVPGDMQALAQSVEQRLWEHPLQEGVSSSGSWMVTQRAAGGAGMFVDVAQNVDYAYVQGDAAPVAGLYPVPPAGAITTLAISANASGNPRVDIVVLEVLLTSPLWQVRAIQGTATSGATLDNRTNAPALPNNCLLLADVLVANGAASITNAVIRDRRKWARGAYARIIRSSGDASMSSGQSTAYNYPGIDAAFGPRVECSGVPVRVRLSGGFSLDVLTAMFFSPQVDFIGVDGMASSGATVLDTNGLAAGRPNATGAVIPLVADHVFVPSAGSHIISAMLGTIAAANITIRARSTAPLIWTVEEIMRQNTPNNSVTTG